MCVKGGWVGLSSQFFGHDWVRRTGFVSFVEWLGDMAARRELGFCYSG